MTGAQLDEVPAADTDTITRDLALFFAIISRCELCHSVRTPANDNHTSGCSYWMFSASKEKALTLAGADQSATDDAIGEGFLRVPLADGGEWVSLRQLTDGRISCCVCFKFCHRGELEPDADEPGQVWDVCRECAAKEARL